MLRWHVDARFDPWSGEWRVTRSDPPGLTFTAPTEASFRARIDERVRELAGDGPFDLTVTTTRQMWTLSLPFVASMLVNGRRVTTRLGERLRLRFAAASPR